MSADDLAAKAQQLKIAVPKNLGDIIYSYKYRKSLPQEIIKTAPEGFYWRIKNVGIAQHEFILTKGSEFVEIDTMLATTKIPDGTPSIVKKYSISDEQALLAIVRYNRLIDIFLGVTCYSLQNHLRTNCDGNWIKLKQMKFMLALIRLDSNLLFQYKQRRYRQARNFTDRARPCFMCREIS